MKISFEFFVAYDVSSNKRRRKLRRIILDYGGEMEQLSLYRLKLKGSKILEFLNELEAHMGEEDKLVLVFLKGSRKKVLKLGEEDHLSWLGR